MTQTQAVCNRVCIIGLDCAAPELVFDLWAHLLPNLTRLRESGVWGRLESTIPPITVPAWMCMMTGKDPGTLGIYGFRNRRDHSYDGLQFASNLLVHEKTIWDYLGEKALRTIALGVPLTYPPKPMTGLMVTDFLAPDTNSNYTYPPELKNEIRDLVGEYLFDTRQFRTEHKEQLLADIRAMTAQRFRLANHLLTTKPWDLFVMVEMGPDRIHHGFWKYFDPKHPRYVAGNPFEYAIRDYYIELDGYIGETIARLEPGTRLLIVSDHGAKRMVGGFCLNQWLIQEGYLRLLVAQEGIVNLTPDLVDWPNTRAWGDGGYYGRVFLNVTGREPNGVVPASEVDHLKAEISAKLGQINTPTGELMDNRIFRPDSIYASARGVPPDLIVYFGDLHWRSIGSVGHSGIHVETNDTGPDDANHAQHGIFIMNTVGREEGRGKREEGTKCIATGERGGLSIYDVAPTVLDAFDIPTPLGVGRNRIISIKDEPPAKRDDAYTEEEEAELARRLEDLGYL